MNHSAIIRHCLQLSVKAGAATGLNPQVGAVIVRDGQIIAEQYHRKWGDSHAERALLEGKKAQSNDVLYVSLEPCCHTGKTPACTDAIIQSGIQTVVFGMLDPNPAVAGQGIAQLRAAGIRVMGPVLPELCRRHVRGFVSLQEQGRPWITLKKAMTSDGQTANPDGSTRKITSLEQDIWSHTWLRASHDAILVGVNTVEADNPSLTLRHTDNLPTGADTRRYRIVLDPQLRIAEDATVVSDNWCNWTIIICDQQTDAEKVSLLQSRGVRIWQMQSVSLLELCSRCQQVSADFFGIKSLLVEGGPATWQTFQQAGLYDEEVLLIGS